MSDCPPEKSEFGLRFRDLLNKEKQLERLEVEASRYRTAVNLQAKINTALLDDVHRYRAALERITRESDGIAFKIAQDALHPVPPSTDA